MWSIWTALSGIVAFFWSSTINLSPIVCHFGSCASIRWTVLDFVSPTMTQLQCADDAVQAIVHHSHRAILLFHGNLVMENICKCSFIRSIFGRFENSNSNRKLTYIHHLWLEANRMPWLAKWAHAKRASHNRNHDPKSKVAIGLFQHLRRWSVHLVEKIHFNKVLIRSNFANRSKINRKLVIWNYRLCKRPISVESIVQSQHFDHRHCKQEKKSISIE